MHFFCSDPTLPNRGNSYFVYLREETDKVQIYKVTNDVFSKSDLAIINYVDTLTMTANVEETVFKKVKELMNEREIVEISVLVGTYNMHTRVFNALQIDLEDSK
jgi:alkylhydroperoxidase family enzyme